MRRLKTLARDGQGRDYEVVLVPSRYSDDITLVIEGTPGQWEMQTLLGLDKWGGGRACSRLSICGDDWICVNFDEVLAEAERVYREVV